MSSYDSVLSVTFNHSNEKAEVKITDWMNDLAEFLEYYGTPYLLGRELGDVMGEGSGVEKSRRLMRATGYENDPHGFCEAIARYLMKADSLHQKPLEMNGIVIPQLLLMSLLEKLLPSNKFVSIKKVDQLEQLANISIPEDQRSDLQEVIDTYPVRLSMHTIRQMRVSKDVAYQYLPFVEELDPVGHTNTWIGQFHQGLLERMYQNRVIFLLNMSCPVYCRFCFRKHKDSRNQENPTTKDVERALEHVRNSPTIKEIVLTGGDPFLNRNNLAYAIDGLKEIPHVQTLRLATRSIAYYPHLFHAHDGELITYLKMKNLDLQLKGKRMEVATHFIHPDEISPDSLDIISQLVGNGIAVYVQTPFLKDCNDQGPELTRLFSLLRGAGAELHYIYIPCSPIHGNSIYWTPIATGLEVAHYLRAHLSDRVIPRICTATPIGKMDWHTSGWAVEQDPEDENFIWIRTPYTPDYFKAFAPLAGKLDMVRVNDEGTIDARYMARIGAPDLFLGSRKAKVEAPAKNMDEKNLKIIQVEVLEDQVIRRSIVSTGSSKVFRLHETRVELDADADEKDLEIIRKAEKVTDVIIASEKDVLDKIHEITHIIHQLHNIPHVNGVRLRSLLFNYSPERYTKPVIERLGRLNRLDVAHPLRLEIETQFLHSNEIRAEHQKVARALSNHGITVYSNTPLLTNVNDSPDEINRIAYGLRSIGIEFHHLYVAGLPLQERWNEKNPVDVSDVIDIGTRIRRDGSGREIPRYIFQTPLGEVDFGLTSKMIADNGTIRLRLNPYDLAYYQSMDAHFSWPHGVEVDPDGKPVVTVKGLKDSGGFLVF